MALTSPNGVLGVKRNVSIAIDAGGNSLVLIDRDGSVETLAVFSPRCVPWPFGPNPVPAEANPCGDQAYFPAQAVPTDVAFLPDGDAVVSTLGGFPFTVGESVVYRLDRDAGGPRLCSTLFPPSGCEVFADGLTALVAIDVDHHGRVYAVQMADGGLLDAFSGAPGADAGSVQILDPHGSPLGSIGGLTLPGGVAVDHKHVYISNNSVFTDIGEVVSAHLYDHH
ncbi:MAG: ScyD/ScyE family protein [Acidimicrobiales bacterium]